MIGGRYYKIIWKESDRIPEVWWVDDEEILELYRESEWTIVPVVVMTPYEFNKDMQDAYNIGKYGPIECPLEDLLERVD